MPGLAGYWERVGARPVAHPRRQVEVVHPLISSDARAVSLSTGSGHTVDEHPKRICNTMTPGRYPGLAGEIRKPGRRSVGARAN
jgi:hypothetical protein